MTGTIRSWASSAWADYPDLSAPFAKAPLVLAELRVGGKVVASTGDAQQSNAAPAAVRDMLDRLYSGGEGGAEDEPPEP